MKIIERGEEPELQPMRCRCNHCRTLFEFLPMEATYVSDQRDGDALKIGCPVCTRDCWVDPRNARANPMCSQGTKEQP